MSTRATIRTHARSAPARVMVLLDTLVAEGAETVAVDLACSLDRSRFEPIVVASRRGGPLEDRLAAHGVELQILGRRGKLDVTPMRRAVQIARSADLVHTHMFGSNVWGAALKRATGTRLVTHEHNWVDGWSSQQAWLQRSWIASVADRTLCVSETVLRSLLAIGVPETNLLVVPNAVAPVEPMPRTAARRVLGLAGDTPVIGIVAGLRVEKNHALLLRAVAALKDTANAPQLCIVGRGECEADLRSLAVQLELDDRVVWAGERSDASRIVSAFDATCLPSRSEGLPLAALESMRAGVPVIASSVGGLTSLLSDGAGVLVAPDNVHALAQAIDTLLGDDTLRVRIGAAGAERVERRHGYSNYVSAVEDMYAEILGLTRPSYETHDMGEAA